jgi:hypothetical protein
MMAMIFNACSRREVAGGQRVFGESLKFSAQLQGFTGDYHVI